MNRSQRRHSKPGGMSLVDRIAREKILREAAQRAACDVTVQIKSDIHTQKMSWLIMLALNDEFQFGQSRYARLAQALHKRSVWFDEMVKGADEEYATEKLRQDAERVTREELEFVWDKELQAARKKNEDGKIARFDKFRFSKPERMAEMLCGWLECQNCPGRELCSHKDGKANGLVKWFAEEVYLHGVQE